MSEEMEGRQRQNSSPASSINLLSQGEIAASRTAEVRIAGPESHTTSRSCKQKFLLKSSALKRLNFGFI